MSTPNKIILLVVGVLVSAVVIFGLRGYLAYKYGGWGSTSPNVSLIQKLVRAGTSYIGEEYHDQNIVCNL